MNLQPTVPTLELFCTATIELSEPLKLGVTSLAERRIIPIVGGRFEGDKLNGEILPGGADWQLVRPDGAALLEARYTLRTSDGSLVYVQNRGIRFGPAETLARLARGEEVDPADYYFRTTPTFETGASDYEWLNNIITIGSGVRRANAVILDMYIVW